jgi:hypothetical protein
MKNPEELIGRKVRGFKFKKYWNKEMINYIGEIGIIKKHFEHNNMMYVSFENRNWAYPADQIEAHLVDEEIPTLSDGVMMLVSYDKQLWHERNVIGKKNDIYYVWANNFIHRYKYAKPLEPTKEEQLTAILGSSEKVNEIM